MRGRPLAGRAAIMITTIISRARRLPPFVAVLLAVAAVVPPAGTYVRHYAVARAAQFIVFAVIAPALLVGGWPAVAGVARAPCGAPI